VIGCSFASGHGVDDSDQICVRMEEISQGDIFYCAATPGYGHDQQYLELKAIHDKINPDFVLIAGYTGSSYRSLLKTRKFYSDFMGKIAERPKPYFSINNNGELEIKNTPVSKWSIVRGEPNIFRPNKLKLLLSRLTDRFSYDRIVYSQKGTENKLVEKIYQEMINFCKRAGSVPILTPLPNRENISNFFAPSYCKFFKQLAQKNGIYFINLREDILHNKNVEIDSLFLKNDNHYSPIGNEYIAKLLINRLNNLYV
jgi:hypothetical protein